MAPAALAQNWPSRPIKLIVSFPPGGLIDNMARLIAPRLAQELGQPIVVDNKPGAGGNLGAGEVSRAAPDGYTLLMASPPLTINPALYKKLPYEPRNIAPIGLLGRVPNVLVVSAASGIQSVAELTARAKARPGELNYASNGNGTSLHLSAELYKNQAGVFVTHIPYRGAAAGLTAVIAGEVSFMFDNLPSALGLIQSGRLRALAVTTAQRSSVLPQVPTMEEAGVKGYQVSAWFGLAAPAGLPAPVQQKLEQALERVAAVEEVKAAMLKAGAEPVWLGAQAMVSFMQADAAQWKKVADFAKISLD
ncbi:MAG TPA: tripartite tricarboxylate transporter substrate binding protein [Ottowia sp.]|nr:tripartite tricarboxylate transporter substrate binding protein [Ottowia sp.]HPP97617.1 tripartite tricarboxylate transporter substrate binding protein [Ottowia sp.]